MNNQVIKKFTGPYVDLGDDLNFYVPEEKGKRDTLSSSLFVDDTIKSVDIAMAETKKRLTPFWLQSEPLMAAYVDEVGESFFFYLSEEMKARVVLFVFIDPYLPHTLRGLPYIKEWLKRYSGAGLTVIGIFYSRFDLQKQVELVQGELHRYHIDFPVFLDQDAAAWRALENRYWPRYLIVNHEQKVVGDYIGAGGYQDIEQTLQQALRLLSPGLACPRFMKLINESDQNLDTDKITNPCFFGFVRGRLANAEPLTDDGNDIIFSQPQLTNLKPGSSFAVGPWLGQPHSMVTSVAPYQKSQFQGDALVGATFNARSVYVLCSTKYYQNTDVNSAIRLQVTLDGKPVRDQYKGGDLKSEDGKKTFIYVHAPRLFEIAKDLNPDEMHRIQITLPQITAGNFEIFAFYYSN